MTGYRTHTLVSHPTQPAECARVREVAIFNRCLGFGHDACRFHCSGFLMLACHVHTQLGRAGGRSSQLARMLSLSSWSSCPGCFTLAYRDHTWPGGADNRSSQVAQTLVLWTVLFCRALFPGVAERAQPKPLLAVSFLKNSIDVCSNRNHPTARAGVRSSGE